MIRSGCRGGVRGAEGCVPRPASFSARLFRTGWLLAVLAAAVPPVEQVAHAAGEIVNVGQRLRSRLEHLPQPIDLEVQGERIHAREALPSFYERRVFAPAWSSDAGPTQRAFELVRAIRESESEGLDPIDYHVEAIEELLSEGDAGGAGALADLDLLLSDAFLMLGAHLVSGRVDPVTFDPEWIAVRREVDLVAVLDRAVSTSSPGAELADLLPPYDGYRSLRSALSTYRRVAAAGGWTSLGPGLSLHPGDTDQRVVELRHRLAATDEIPSSDNEETMFDAPLERAVRSFQARHGLDEDGVVGAKTLAALNVPATERAEQLLLNLERWRWLPQDLGQRYLVVNIAAFQLVLVEQGEAPRTMRVAVGRSYRRTPVFSDRIRYLVLNPFWEVPQKLAVQDKLPEILRDPSYLERMGFKVFQGWGEAQHPVDPSTVDWSSLSGAYFPYRLRQDPGPLNALGRVKFMFPNRFNVYLHDTPAREVFQQSERDVSSGCIRVERPLELMDWLLRGAGGWDPAKARDALTTGRETVVPLSQPVPIHLLYWTAWVDDGGAVQFRRDLYDRDAALAKALERAHDLAG